MKVINVTSIKDTITGYAGVCYPVLDAGGNWILAQDSLTDGLLEPILEQIAACPLIDYNPVVVNIP